MSIFLKAGSALVYHYMELLSFLLTKRWGPLYVYGLPGIKQINEIGPLSLTQVDDLPNRLTHAHYLRSIDLRSGYHYGWIALGDEPKRVFVLRFSLYEFTVLPFGLCNALSTFQCFMNHVFSDIVDWYVLVYLDNIAIV